MGTGSHAARGVGRQTFKILLRSRFRPRAMVASLREDEGGALYKSVDHVQMCRPQADFYCVDTTHRPYLEASLLPMLLMWG